MLTLLKLYTIALCEKQMKISVVNHFNNLDFANDLKTHFPFEVELQHCINPIQSNGITIKKLVLLIRNNNRLVLTQFMNDSFFSVSPCLMNSNQTKQFICESVCQVKVIDSTTHSLNDTMRAFLKLAPH